MARGATFPTRRAVLAALLGLPAARVAVAADAGPAEVELGAMTFPILGVREVTHVVVRVTVSFATPDLAERHGTPSAIVRMRDAALGALRDTRLGEIDEAAGRAVTRRVEAAIARRVPGVAGLRIDVLGARSVPRT